MESPYNASFWLHKEWLKVIDMQALQKLPICFFMPKWKTYSFRVLLLFAYVSDTPSTFLQLSLFMQGTNLLNHCVNLGFLFYLLFCLTLVCFNIYSCNSCSSLATTLHQWTSVRQRLARLFCSRRICTRHIFPGLLCPETRLAWGRTLKLDFEGSRRCQVHLRTSLCSSCVRPQRTACLQQHATSST